MNGAADLGGMMGFGPVQREDNEPPFHAEWERRAFALTLAMGATGSWTLDASRFARESLPPPIYLTASYYEIWLRALEKQILERGLADAGEMESGEAESPATATRRPPLGADDVSPVLARGFPYDRPAPAPARFAVGAPVRTKVINPKGHTRLPRYARGKEGVVETVHEGFVFPDSNAHGQGERPQRVYTVVFDGAEIWGEGADPTLSVSVDAWESYLERA